MRHRFIAGLLIPRRFHEANVLSMQLAAEGKAPSRMRSVPVDESTEFSEKSMVLS